MTYLSGTEAAGAFDISEALTRVMRQGGPGAWRQVWQILRLRLGFRGMNMADYYDFGLWRPKEGPVLRRELLPAARVRAFNDALRMPGHGPDDAAIDDKLATAAILSARGLPVTPTLAAYVAPGDEAPLPPGVRPLRTAAEIADFLRAPGTWPLFGKPRRDSFARGAAGITGVSADGAALNFLDGQSVPVAGLAHEIARDWATGYLFQPFARMPAAMQHHLGPAMASVRIATLLTDRGVEPWYAVLRIPAKRAMHDGDARSMRVWGLVDLDSGRLLRLRNLKDPNTPDVTHWLDPDTPLLGLELPHWAQAVAAVRAGHESFGANGILGWDVFLTEDSVLLNEVNANPGPVYQNAAARGMRNADMMPAYDRALALARRKRGRRG